MRIHTKLRDLLKMKTMTMRLGMSSSRIWSINIGRNEKRDVRNNSDFENHSLDMTYPKGEGALVHPQHVHSHDWKSMVVMSKLTKQHSSCVSHSDFQKPRSHTASSVASKVTLSRHDVVSRFFVGFLKKKFIFCVYLSFIIYKIFLAILDGDKVQKT